MSKKINFITEIASSHDGSIKTVEYLIKKHIKSSSRYIKFQIFKANKLYNKNDKNYKKFLKIKINFNNWKKIINKYKNKINIILEPFDSESYEFCKLFKTKVDIKISTSETDNLILIKDSLKNFKKIFINLSGYSFEEIKIVLKSIKNEYKRKIVLMYGFQAYPSLPDQLRFDLFDYFQSKGFKYGYADHSIYGFSNDLIKCLFLAINKKCMYFEKHVCKKISMKPNDYISSVEFDDLERIINLSSDYFNIGKKKKSLEVTSSEKNYANIMHKKAFLKIELKKGNLLNLNNILFLRSSSKEKGINRLFFLKKKIILKKNLKRNRLIKKKNLLIK